MFKKNSILFLVTAVSLTTIASQAADVLHPSIPQVESSTAGKMTFCPPSPFTSSKVVAIESDDHLSGEELYTKAWDIRYPEPSVPGRFFGLMKKAAVKGHKKAQCEVALMLKIGRDCVSNLEESIEWYRKSAAQDYAPAENTLGVMHELGNQFIEKDPLAALDWYGRASKHGYELGTTNLIRLTKELERELDEQEAMEKADK